MTGEQNSYKPLNLDKIYFIFIFPVHGFDLLMMTDNFIFTFIYVIFKCLCMIFKYDAYKKQ